ncbi:MAG: beta-galactosidase trimerization domain-containing protein [Kiritimatiellae bacterium]|nr:beta-galactosidase trimerization domain-containing protein [Kiritimatiellia bacterium]
MSEFDPQVYADRMEMSKVDTAIVYASSCLGNCYWPTQTGHMHRGLKGRDILGETIKCLRNKNINTVVYFNIWSRWACLNHPEWQMRDGEGRGTLEYLWSPGRYGVCCPNSPYGGFVLKQIRELCLQYEFEGLWIDMIGWVPGICFCRHCRDRYMKDAGRDIPETVNWTDPQWVAFQRWRESCMAEFAGQITGTAKALKPGVSVAHQSAIWASGWHNGFSQAFLRQSDYLAGDFYCTWLTEHSFNCEALDRLTPDRPMEFMTSVHTGLDDHTTLKTTDLLAAQICTAIAHNAAFVFIDAIDPVGTIRADVYDRMGAMYDILKRYEPYLDSDALPLRDIAIYFNFESLIDMRQNGVPAAKVAASNPLMGVIANILRTLMDAHLPCTLITDKNLHELKQYQVVILPDIIVMDKREVDAFDDYVGNGGSLYVSKRTSLLNRDGSQNADFQLADVLGVSYRGETREAATYMSPTREGNGLFPACSSKYPLFISDPQVKISCSADASVLATLVLPYSDSGDPNNTAAAISNPPGIPTDLPALVMRNHGRGRVIYSAGHIEKMEHEEHRLVLTALLRRLLTRPLVATTDAPKAVELTVYEQPRNRRRIVNLLNFQKDLPNIPVEGIQVRLWLNGKKVRSVMTLPEQEPVSHTIDADHLLFAAPKLTTFIMFAVDFW